MSTHRKPPERNDAGVWAQEPPSDTTGGHEPPRDETPGDKEHPPGGHGPGGHDHNGGQNHAGCCHVPDFKRLNYFYGQMLGAADFRAEQDYFREKQKLHNRCLHGYGVVCGLRVTPVPLDENCVPEGDARVRRLAEELRRLEEIVEKARQAGDETTVKERQPRIEEIRRELERITTEACEDETPTRVVVECGLALDCEGNEIVVRRPVTIDLWRELSRADRDKVKDDAAGKKGGAAKRPDPKTKEASGGYDKAGEAGSYHDPGAGAGYDNAGEGADYDNAGETADYGAGGKEYEPAPGVEGGVYPDGGQSGSTLYLSICFCEQPTDPVRPVMPEACGLPPECSYGKTRDSFRVRVTYDRPDVDDRCETCCECCADKCLLLARLDNFRPGEALDAADIHNEVRRPVSLYVPTVITGISWTDGAEYTENEAEGLLGISPEGEEHPPKGYMLVRFSRQVHVSTIRPGVIDVWVTEGGGTQHAGAYVHDVEYVELPASGTVDRVRFRVKSDESPNPGDRVMIFVRGSRILDQCCRPIDAANTGGRTPFVPDAEFKDYRRESPTPECQYPPPFGYGPWTSGTNAAGSDFVSWFYIKANPRYGQSKKAS